jgi:hypothetical protein
MRWSGHKPLRVAVKLYREVRQSELRAEVEAMEAGRKAAVDLGQAP